MADGPIPDPQPANGRRPAGRAGNPGLRMTLGLHREPASIGVARRVVDTALQAAEVDPNRRDKLLLALTEACANVVKHAQGSDGYEVRLTFDDDCCIVDIIDTGRHQLRLPTDLTPPDPTHEPGRGRGLSIIAALTDSLHLTPRSPHGLAVRFTKRLS
jgi:serine/threonine-protein kinase RsbW